MMFESISMIRNGSFGTNFEIKLIVCIFAIILCFVDFFMKNKRKDYFWVFFWGTIIWGSVEYVLQISADRNIHQAILFGIELPLIVASLLQGMSEGAFIAILGIFVGDRIITSDIKERLIGMIVFTVWTAYAVIRTIIQECAFKDIGGIVASRRIMFSLKSNIFLLLMVVIGIYWLWRAVKTTRKRGISMYLVMFFFATIWTITEYYANTRWIEIGSLDNLIQAPFLITFGMLAYDVVIEITGAYLPFLAIPYMLGQISDERT